MAKTKVSVSDLLEFIRDEKSLADVLQVIRESGESATMIQRLTQLAQRKFEMIEPSPAGRERKGR